MPTAPTRHGCGGGSDGVRSGLPSLMKLSLLRYLCEPPSQGRINLRDQPVNEYWR
jgi:hypothetical protein